MAAGFSRVLRGSRRVSDSCSTAIAIDRRGSGHSRSWWRLVPAVLIVVGAVAVLPATAGAAPTAPPSTWNNVTPTSGGPVGLSNAAMTNDAANSGSLLFGGEDNTGTFQDGTWVWDGTAWDQQSPTTSPTARINAALARTQSGTTNGAILFGGFDGTNYLADTWTWDGTNWTEQTPATSPPARAGATIEYFDGQVVLFGGYNGTSYLNDTWAWDGTTWTEQSGTNPPARAYASMAEDTGYAFGTGALVLFGGFNGTSYLGDTWTYTATGWTQQTPTTSPSARAYAAMAYNGTLAEPTIFGGYNGTAVLADTWEYTGTNNWVDQSPTTNPPARMDAAMADNSTDGQLVLFGGQATTATSSALGDTWTFYSAPDAPTGVTAVPDNAQATVTFDAVPFYGNGGYTITSYTVTSSGGQTCTVTPGSGTPPATYNCTVTGLTNGTSYTFTVTSTNFQGTGLPSTASAAVVPATVPGAPTIGTGHRRQRPGLGGLHRSGVQRRVGHHPLHGDRHRHHQQRATADRRPPAATSPLVVAGLTNGDSYTFTVTATNANGTGLASAPPTPWCRPPSRVVRPASRPPAATPGPRWPSPHRRPTAGRPSPTTRWSPPTPPTAASGGQRVTGGTSPLVVAGLTNGDHYTFTVTASNRAGAGLASTPSNAVVPNIVPGRPTGVTGHRRQCPGLGGLHRTGAQRGDSHHPLHGGRHRHHQQQPRGTEGHRRDQPAGRRRAHQRRPLHLHGDGLQQRRCRGAVQPVQRGRPGGVTARQTS